eukprot:2140758-Rhodomonas_salina.1
MSRDLERVVRQAQEDEHVSKETVATCWAGTVLHQCPHQHPNQTDCELTVRSRSFQQPAMLRRWLSLSTPENEPDAT